MEEAIEATAKYFQREVDPDAHARDQVMLDALNSPYANQVKEDMKLIIKDAVKNGLWRKLKVIPNADVRKKATQIVLEICAFNSMQGDSADAKAYKDKWIVLYEKHIAKALNELRSYVQSRIKAKVEAYWRKHDKTMPPLARLLALIRRDFPLPEGQLSPEDYDLFNWWVTQILPLAAGNQSDWGPEHFLYMTVQEGHYPGNPRKLYITDSTEAIAVWLIENNYESWPETWAAKDLHGSYQIIKKAKEDNGDNITYENSRVSDLFMYFCP
jgi:hypothetical protein